MFLTPTNEIEIQNIIAELKNMKSTDLFDLPVDIIKCSAVNIAFSLTHLINQSLATGIVPISMKAAVITTIYKSGDVFENMNYRPISKLSCFSKISEKVMHKRT